MHVAFLNENTLGHASYLMPFVRWFETHPEAGIRPHVIHATPLPPHLRLRADFSIRGLRKAGLDFHNARWRLTVSAHVREQLDKLRGQHEIAAAVVNTQSVALQLAEVASELPLGVCLDATFQQLANSRWFAPNPLSRWMLPLTAGILMAPERALFHAAARLFPWSESAAASLQHDYGEPRSKSALLPPSLDLSNLPCRLRGKPDGVPQLLFIGGDFVRKGGPLLLEVFRESFSGRAHLHIVTEAPLTEEKCVTVHRGVKAYSPEWRRLWDQADVFVFPSTLETYGIVLLEAMAFGVPVISSAAGAAAELIGADERGLLLPDGEASTLRAAIQAALEDRTAAERRSTAARRFIEERHNLAVNAGALGNILRELAGTKLR